MLVLVCCSTEVFTKASSPLALPPEEEKEKIGRIVKLLLYAEHFDDGKRSSEHSARRAKENSPPIYRLGVRKGKTSIPPQGRKRI